MASSRVWEESLQASIFGSANGAASSAPHHAASDTRMPAPAPASFEEEEEEEDDRGYVPMPTNFGADGGPYAHYAT